MNYNYFTAVWEEQKIYANMWTPSKGWPLGLVKFEEDGYKIVVNLTDADTHIAGGHGHIKKPNDVGARVSLDNGIIYDKHHNVIGSLPKKILEKLKASSKNLPPKNNKHRKIRNLLNGRGEFLECA